MEEGPLGLSLVGAAVLEGLPVKLGVSEDAGGVEGMLCVGTDEAVVVEVDCMPYVLEVQRDPEEFSVDNMGR